VAESLWSRLIALTRCFLIGASHMPESRWNQAVHMSCEAYDLRPCAANPGRKSPFEMRTGRKPDTKHLRSFGQVGYVYEEKHPGFAVRARKAYCVGYSRAHAKGCYDMYHPDTKRTKKGCINVFWPDMVESDAHALPMDMEFDLRPAGVRQSQNLLSLSSVPSNGMGAPHLVPPAPGGAASAPLHSRRRRTLRPSNMPSTAPTCSVSGTSIPTALCNDCPSNKPPPPHALLRLGANFGAGKQSGYRLQRMQRVSGYSVDAALRMVVPDKHGTHLRYQRKGLHYDLKHNGLVASVPVADAVNTLPEPPTPSMHYCNNRVSVSKLLNHGSLPMLRKA
jgi:hypothetical protein